MELVLVGKVPYPKDPTSTGSRGTSGKQRLGAVDKDQVVVLVGTETGSAKDLAGELAVTLEVAGIETEVVDMEDAFPGLLNVSRAVIICTATTGLGDLPENSMEFFEALGEEWPDLRGMMFCVCGLGDSIYQDFCEAGKIWSHFLADLGAMEVVERYEIDGFPDQEDVKGACEWVERAAERFDELAGRARTVQEGSVAMKPSVGSATAREVPRRW